MARRNRRRLAHSAFGSRRNKARARRNFWTEPGSPFMIKKAKEHRKAALKGWSRKRKSKAKARKAKAKKTVIVVQAAPKKPKAKARKAKAKKTVIVVQAAPKKPKRQKAKARKASAAPVKARKNRVRRNRRHVRRNRHRRNKRHGFKMVKRNRHRRNRHRRNARRNGPMMEIGMKIGALAVAMGAAAYLGSKVSEKVVESLPMQLREYAPAIMTGGVTIGLVMLAKKLKVIPERFIPMIMFGGAASAVFQLFAHVKTKEGLSLAQKLGLPFTSTHTEIAAPPAEAVTGTAGAKTVAGLAGRFGAYGVGNFGAYGVGSTSSFNGYSPMEGVIDVNGRPLAVEGLLDVPGGGQLMVEGTSTFNGLAGDGIFTDSVMGTQTDATEGAPNPFAPGLREGNRGTWNEPHAAQVADSGSLSGNIFS